MNLHGIVRGAIQAVNPDVTVVVQRSSGYTTNADGTQVPLVTPLNASVQIQALSTHELKHLDDLNIQGVVRKLYAYGHANSIIRDAEKGGDNILWDCQLWKVVHVFETWPDWSAVAIRRQVRPV